jgi:hypothetical protein
MTEEEWLAGTDLGALLRWDRVRRSRRKLRLFSCACARQLEPWFQNPRLLKALDASERYADGLIKDAGIGKWNAETNRLRQAADLSDRPDKRAFVTAHWAVAYSCMAEKYGGYQDIAARVLRPEAGFGAEDRAELEGRFLVLLRDIFGNPFRRARFNKHWRTDPVVSLARTMYEAREFSAMPILADALQDAGCDSADTLDHCRDPNQVHVRGCWVVDCVLGKA